MTTPEDVSGTNDVPHEVINEVAGYYLVDLRGSPNIPPHNEKNRGA